MNMSDETPATPKPFWVDRKIIAAGVGVFLLGWFLGQQPVNPWKPQKDRPVLTLLAKVAKTGLWLLVVEPVPDNLPEYTVVADHNRINHRRGW